MSDVSSGPRAPDGTYGTDAPTPPLADPGTSRPYPSGAVTDARSTARPPAGRGTTAPGPGSDVKETAKGQAQRVGAEAKAQAGNVAADVRDRLSDQARTGNDRLVTNIRQTADQLDEMRRDRPDTPIATAVTTVADGGRRLADYLDRNGPDGVLRDVQDFARRRPGAFLAAAIAAGFVVGRLGKGVVKADPGAGKPRRDSFVSAPGDRFEAGTAGYGEPSIPATGTPAGTTIATEYAATGTGTPVAVEEEYVIERVEDRR